MKNATVASNTEVLTHVATGVTGTSTEDQIFTREDVLSGDMFTRKQLMDNIVKLSEQLEGCLEGLRFYSDRKTYHKCYYGPIEDRKFGSPIEEDQGSKATVLIIDMCMEEENENENN